MATVMVAERELAEAEVLWMVSRMVSGGSYSKKVNNRQVSEAVGQMTDAQRKSLADQANALRRKNGMAPFTTQVWITDASHLWK